MRGLVMFALSILLLLTACSVSTADTQSTDSVPTSVFPTIEVPTIEIPTISTDNAQTTATALPETSPSAGAATTVTEDGSYQVDVAARSDDDTLAEIELRLLSAELVDESLTVRVSFRNLGEESFTVFGTISGLNAELVDASGRVYPAEAVSDELAGGIGPTEGFTPGAANVGTITFPRPGDGPYDLRFPTYDAISFALDTPLDDASLAVGEGSFPVEQSLGSVEDALREISLDVLTMTVEADSISFDVAFTNRSSQGYDLLVGPQGADARLLDAEGMQYEPSEVSDNFAESIAPEGGWLPEQAHAGTLTFERPSAIGELRLTFPSYDALTIALDESGVASAEITSASGGAPQPTPTPSGAELALDELRTFVETQGAALASSNIDEYLNSFDPAMRDEQRLIAERGATMPLRDLQITILGQPSDRDIERGEVRNVGVQLSYLLEGVPEANRFVHDLEYDLVRNGENWQISEVSTGDNPPFWHLGDVVARESEHFLLFARPELEGELDLIAQESEAAYAELRARNLPLDERYVVYATADSGDFQDNTGGFGRRALGVALSRYTFEAEQIGVTGYAFYLNGEAQEEASAAGAGDRQLTITHELVHLALANATRPFTPPWVAEGAAVYFSGDTGPEQQQLLLEGGALENITLATLTTAETLGEHDFLGQQVGYEYIFAGETFAYLIEQFGEQAVLDFYRSYADVATEEVRERMPAFGSAFAADAAFTELREELTASAVQEYFGVSLEQLDADVKAWLAS